jgi:endonuclease/exonuclease/phosphatase (EEP) superfamily protein YafD
MSLLHILIYLFSTILVTTVLLPLWKKDIWIVRIFDYPRIQKFSLVAVLCFFWLYYMHEGAAWYDFLLFAILVGCLVHLLVLILPFTPLGKKMIGKATLTGNKPTFNILVSNVYQENKQYDKVLQMIQRRNPDIVFLLETNKTWQDAVKSLHVDFPYSIELPLENTYGLLFYSKWPILHQQINYLIDQEIPSVIAEVAFHHHTIKIFGLHPSPPVPQENSYSTDRDAEILMVGKMTKKETGPCLVIGDLNDVAWSYTTKLFLKISGMLDPRRGRGLYSTFHARYPFFRWPLDHFFVSKHFDLVTMKVEKHIGSDHFPISISLLLSGQEDSHPLQGDADDMKLANEKIQAALEDDPR